MKVSGDWLSGRATQVLFDVYAAHGFKLFVVGGSVRNALLGLSVTDIDMSSDARPDVASKFLEAAGFRVVPTGIDHGTITAVSEGIPHEITTFRKDVATDGRRAVVAFSGDIADDAMRRDFTINALYSDRDGTVLDPLSGLADIDGPRIRFIGHADDRIREDYLRSLRFFRFHAQYAPAGAGMNADAMDAIARNLEGLNNLSRERVGAEILKLLGAPDPSEALGAMLQTGALNCVLPGADPRSVGPMVHLEDTADLKPDSILRLAALCNEELAATLRLSKNALKRLTILRQFAMDPMSLGELGYRLKADAKAALVLRSALLESPMPMGWSEHLERGQSAIFPIKPADLIAKYTGAALGEKLRGLEAKWIASDFTATKDQLLA